MLFKQEYPANATEAFIASGTMQFIQSDQAEAAARRAPYWSAGDPIILGVDVARFGDDDSVIAIRRGRDARSLPWEKYRGLDTMQLSAKVQDCFNRMGATICFVDETGIGAGVVDRLAQLNVPVVGVNFGSGADRVLLPGGDTIRVKNKRAEIWAKMRAWLNKGAIPNDRHLITDLVNVHYGYDADSAIQLEKKDDMKKRGLSSPDRGDALALTFSFPVQLGTDAAEFRPKRTRAGSTGY